MNMETAKDMPQLTPRERAWKAIREAKQDFTIESIALAAEMKIDATRDYLTGLKNGGFITETHRESKPCTVGGNTKVVYYKLIKDVGNQAPAVNRKGEILKPRGVNQAMWTALRINGAVTPRALAAFASTADRQVSEETANSYLQALRNAGYLSIVSPATYAKQASYLLLPIMNTGAKPPQISRACRVFDPNVGRVMYQEKPELAEELREGTTISVGELNHA